MILRRFEKGLAAGLALAALTAPVVSHAEIASCRIPERINAPRSSSIPRPDEVRRMPVSGYTLALSWTPQYCARAEGYDMQCDKAIGRFGFVLHGLWPDGTTRDGRHSWPQFCTPAAPLSRETIARNLCMIPSIRLMQHQWAKHGTCMAHRPDDYYARARAVYQSIRLPDMGWLAAQRRITAGKVAGVVARANPGMTLDMIRVQASDYGLLNELWICLDTAFKPAPCPAGKAGMSLNARIAIRTGY